MSRRHHRRGRRRSAGRARAALIGLAGLAGLIGVAGGACSGSKDPTPSRFDGGAPPRRVIEPPPRDVRALPPHAIAADGVGPYQLRVPMAQMLASLPSGPRMALLQIPGVLDYSAVRDEGLVVGGERQGDASFIAVLRPGIARTDDGIGVGSTSSEVERLMGPAVAGPVARDPHLWVGARMPGARFVLDRGLVAGLLLTTPAAGMSVGGDADGGVAPAPASRCDRSPVDQEAFASAAPRGGARFVAACAGPVDAVGVAGDQLILAARGGEGRARRVASLELPGLRWAAPLAGSGDRDEIVAVTEQRGTGERGFSVIVFRVDGGRLTRVAEVDAYHLDDTSAAWIGAAVGDLDLLLEVGSERDEVLIGGVLVHQRNGAIRDLAPLLPVTVRRRRVGDDARDERGRDAGADEIGDAGPDSRPDGGRGPRDAGAPRPARVDAGSGRADGGPGH